MAARRASGATSAPTRKARSTQAAATSGDGDPRAVVRALKRELSRLDAVDSKLTEAEMSLDGLRRERDQQKKRTDQAQASLNTLTETLEAIRAIRHGKRVDRRLAKAQKLAERGLRRAALPNSASGRRRRPGPGG
jgi:chromosome segregation ATPase